MRPLKNKVFLKRTLIGQDHPFSLGARVVVFTDSAYSPNRLKTSVLKKYLDSISPGLAESNACCVWDSEVRCHVLVFMSKAAEYELDRRRWIEIITHECSHLVDNIFRFIGEPDLKGEARAYFHDWVVGKVTEEIGFLDFKARK